ncbi:MAG: dihydrolipoyllysine-residue succinyltransferase [Xanthomonadales bacterium]|nr:dihydrolipoyllysine-residue succinyltransferase [Xanthomonadales bacterium]|tara:strand:+ start:695 stop:1993 length:1299 start_codon:yes stop_codon:yes gene_type:complete
MSTEVKVPTLPESVSDATVAKWHKKAGDSVKRDENLVDLETDKVVLEVPAPADGVLESIDAEEGETVNADDLLGRIAEGESGDDSDDGKEEKEEERKEAGDEQDKKDSGDEDKATEEKKDKKKSGEKESTDKGADQESSDRGKTTHEAPEGADKLAPAVRKMVTEHGLEPGEIEGTGRDGRITKADVLRHIGTSGKAGGARPEERVKMSRLRQRVSERMKEAQNTAAILTSFNEVDLHEVMQIRSRYKEAFQKRHGVKLGFMSFFVKACCEALDKHPVVNASVDGDEIVYHGYQDVGIAVSTDRGLMVPVLRNAGNMGLAQIEAQIAEYAEKARAGKIQLEDLQGGTFSITNGGVFGSLLSTPLLNPPQSAILGMHTIKERPVAIDGEIVVRPMMYIALSYDHRIIDGKDAVQFLVAVKEALEDPARMLLGL